MADTITTTTGIPHAQPADNDHQDIPKSVMAADVAASDDEHDVELPVAMPLSGTKRPFVGDDAEKESQTTTGDIAVSLAESGVLGTAADSKVAEMIVTTDGNVDDHISTTEKPGNGNDNEENDDAEEVICKPVCNLPEGVTLEWAADQQSATLCISDCSEMMKIGQETRVCLVGRATVCVEEGSAEVLGHVILAKSDMNTTTLISPFWSSWMTIQATSLPTKLLFRVIRGPQSFRIVAPTRPTVIPQEWQDAAQSMVEQFCPKIFPGQFHASAALAQRSLEDNLDDAPAEFDHPRQICAITGGKGVGKSTFLRFVTNRMLSNQCNVAVLDIDVGQPEVAPPGVLRLAIIKKPLLHPPYWNLVGSGTGGEDSGAPLPADGIEIVSSVFFGSETSKADPNRFVEAVLFLLDQYQQKVVSKSPVSIPLVVNMDGWVKGLGFQIMTAMLNTMRPTHIVQILGETRAQTFDLPSALNNDLSETVQIFTLPACTIMNNASICQIPSLTMRNFRWASYFLPSMIDSIDAWDFVSAKDLQTGWIATAGWQFQNDSIEGRQTDGFDDECCLAQALAREKPFCVPMEAVECLVVGSDFEDVFRAHGNETAEEKLRRLHRIFQSMNGQIIGLCTNLSSMEALGCAILRSIDWKRQLLFVLVPPSIPEHSLPKTVALVKGALPLPLSMLYRGVFSESFPYMDSPSASILGSTPMKSRNNIARKGGNPNAFTFTNRRN